MVLVSFEFSPGSTALHFKAVAPCPLQIVERIEKEKRKRLVRVEEREGEESLNKNLNGTKSKRGAK